MKMNNRKTVIVGSIILFAFHYFEWKSIRANYAHELELSIIDGAWMISQTILLLIFFLAFMKAYAD